MKKLKEIDYLLRDLLVMMNANEGADTGHDSAWKNGFQACDKKRISQVTKIRQRIVRFRQDALCKGKHKND